MKDLKWRQRRLYLPSRNVSGSVGDAVASVCTTDGSTVEVAGYVGTLTEALHRKGILDDDDIAKLLGQAFSTDAGPMRSEGRKAYALRLLRLACFWSFFVAVIWFFPDF